VSPFLVSTRFTCDDISRLGRESLSTVKPEGKLTSITAMLLSFASLLGTNLVNANNRLQRSFSLGEIRDTQRINDLVFISRRYQREDRMDECKKISMQLI